MLKLVRYIPVLPLRYKKKATIKHLILSKHLSCYSYIFHNSDQQGFFTKLNCKSKNLVFKQFKFFIFIQYQIFKLFNVKLTEKSIETSHKIVLLVKFVQNGLALIANLLNLSNLPNLEIHLCN